MRAGHRIATAKGGTHQPVRLRCLGGDAAPEDIVADAERANRLSDAAIADLWRVLEPCVLQPMTQALERELGAFCRHFELAEADLGHAIRIASFLLRRAAAVNLSADDFSEDLATVWPQAESLRALLVERYATMVAHLRDSLLAEALLKHGNVLAGLDWRVDRVVADSKAPRLDLPVALITMNYRNRDRSENITLQMTPNQLARAASVFSALAKQVGSLIPAQSETPAESE